MVKEINNITDIGEIPESNEFQKVNQVSQGKTGEPSISKDGLSHVADTVKGIFTEHSEKLFALIALVGYTFVFNSGHIQDWDAFYRYSVFLIVIIAFYTILLSGKSFCNYVLKTYSKISDKIKKVFNKVLDKIKKVFNK